MAQHPHLRQLSCRRPSRPGMPDLQLGKLARINIVLTPILVLGSLGLAQLVPVAAAPPSSPPDPGTNAPTTHSHHPKASSAPPATRPSRLGDAPPIPDAAVALAPHHKAPARS